MTEQVVITGLTLKDILEIGQLKTAAEIQKALKSAKAKVSVEQGELSTEEE